ncbi:hypothetical protein BDZ94DRAFT_1319961 [Collybia nuda]|uniref:Uncharacterized protein n=1 Tax=Collybia nuda TaxID=64659 RepID=A0A9P5YCM1_9AGAR|nr:hypothetical protein BDZ94DRAFT_1319961 [Collybia nuda]
MVTSNNGISVWMQNTRTFLEFSHTSPTITTNAAGITSIITNITFKRSRFSHGIQLYIEKALGFSCLCSIVSSTAYGDDVREGNIYMSDSDTETSTLHIQRPSSKEYRHLRLPRAPPDPTNTNMGAIRVEVFRGPNLVNFREWNSYGGFEPDWNPSEIFVFRFWHQKINGDTLPLSSEENSSSHHSSHTNTRINSRHQTSKPEHMNDVNLERQKENIQTNFHTTIPIPSWLRESRGSSQGPSRLIRKRRELSSDLDEKLEGCTSGLSRPKRKRRAVPVISISSDSDEEVEILPKALPANYRAALKSVETAKFSPRRGNSVNAKLWEAEELLAKENKRQEDLQLQLLRYIQEKTEQRKRENAQLDAIIEAQRNN